MYDLKQTSQAMLTIDINWRKANRIHHEEFFVPAFNFYRDIFPGSFLEQICSPMVFNRRISKTANPGDLVPPYDKNQVVSLPLNAVKEKAASLCRGRFYPKGILSGIPGIFSENRQPFKLTDKTPSSIIVDLHHPLADIPLEIGFRFSPLASMSEERGGSCTDWIEMALDGPGMQSSLFDDFLTDLPLEREDETADPIFYKPERLVHHVDTTASKHLSNIYASFLSKGDQVLDLMAGWVSHLPENLGLSEVVGLGMNLNEMNANPALTQKIVHDLNADTVLPLEDAQLDAVICSLSIEYLTRPKAILKEVLRVLKPGGRFIVGFSNRFFPEKAFKGWEAMHDFERMGFVLALIETASQFQNLETYSVRGYPRPYDDRHFPSLRHSDPIYVVTAVKRS